MKVFFTASQGGKKSFGRYYTKILEEIKKQGFNIVKDDFFSYSPEEYYKKLELGGKKANQELFREKISSIQEADINIFDCSFHSLSIGYMVQKSLEINKPTILLFYKDNEPYFLEGAGDGQDKLITKSYNDKNIKSIVREALDLAKERRDKRFNFFINPKLLGYLEKTSKHEGMTKSTFIRNLILEHMRKSQVKNA